MKVHLIKHQTVENFVKENARSRVSFDKFLNELKYADWNRPDDIKKTFGTADLLGNGSNRVVFDIGGNAFRLIGKYYFGAEKVHLFICWIGTHAKYDNICSENEQYTIHHY